MPACSWAKNVPVRPKPVMISSAMRCTLVAVAERARAAQVLGVVHRHAGRALHQRLDDQRRGFAVMLLEVALERLRAAHGVVARGLPLLREPPVRARAPGCSP